jgi:hypothetical protein
MNDSARPVEPQLIDRVALRHEIARRELHDKARGNRDLNEVLLLIDAAARVPVEGADGLDAETLTKALGIVRARGERATLSGEHVHWTDAEVAALAAAEYARLRASVTPVASSDRLREAAQAMLDTTVAYRSVTPYLREQDAIEKRWGEAFNALHAALASSDPAVTGGGEPTDE